MPPFKSLCRLLLPICISPVTTACNDSGEAMESGTTGTSTGALDDTGTTDSGADSTGGSPSPGCMDPQGTNDSPATAFDLGPWVTFTTDYRHSLDGVVCDTDTDYFTFTPPCSDGFLLVELQANDATDLSDDLTLVLSEDSTDLVVSQGAPNVGAHRMEFAHQAVGSDTYLIEVRHEDGGQVPYEMIVAYLPTGDCSSADWTCEAVSTLEATRTACDGEPVQQGECDTNDVVETTVDLPTVGVGGEAFDGWVVTTAPSEVRYHGDPTSAELSLIAGRCEDACEAEYAADPFVSANCSAGFETPTLYNRPGIPAQAIIPSAFQDGSGLFAGQSLSCNLHSCAADFDERLGPAIPARVTPAGHPLGLGQEWELTVTGAAHAGSDDAMADTDATLTGTIGYSFCEEGDGVNCAFYIGALHLEATETLEIDLDCGGGSEEHEIDDLEVDLIQPAFGISENGTSYKAFPPLSLVVTASAEVDTEPMSFIGAIEIPVYYQAGEGWTLLQGAGGAYLEVLVPCDETVSTVKLWWSFEEDQIVESPPNVGLSLPDTVDCPDDLELTLATGTDPDDDLASLEWVVDGVLMSDEWPTLDFTQAHEITAVLRDARGATASDTKTVTCD